MTSNIGSRQLKDFGAGVGFGTASRQEQADENAKKVIEVAKIKDSDVILSLNEAICLNIKLMRLSTKMIPSHVKTEEYDKIYKNKVYTKFNYNKLVEIKNNSVLI